MKLKELIGKMSYGTHYKLLGAKTGKHLADSWKNKEDFIKTFFEDDVSGLFPSFDTQKDHITKVPQYIRPMICIWLSGR